ncbi:uncharacterized protein LOC117180147 [Belonocnema kinseyi]|uniref:uncharacterized protein LOC117180147 n=1 Tax=Belonocnema kinseyi TaxID=2817044 RepID=UPI00143CD717|nr:uncharacterized protein LOC117180147 [Belonocnema kinseyi]
MQLPGGSTRIPPASAPAAFFATINGSNIIDKYNNKNKSKSSRTSASRYRRGSGRNKECCTSLDHVPIPLKNRRGFDLISIRRYRDTEQHRLLASTPRRKVSVKE